MQISSSSGNSALYALQRLFSGGSGGASAGQEVPGGGKKPPSGGGQACSGMGGPQMAAGTMAAVLGLQSPPPSDADVANSLISALDKDGDGKVSQNEIQQAFQSAGINADVSQAFASVDKDGDGQIDSSELTSAVSTARANAQSQSAQAAPPPHGHHHHGAHAAELILSSFDTDGQAGLSQNEVASALGEDSTSSTLTQNFNALDANGDGVLSADELASAIQTQMQAAQRAYASQLTQSADASAIGATA